MPDDIGTLTGQNQIQGTVSAVLFCNEENGYTVLKLDCAEKGAVTAVGCMPGVAPGEALGVVGPFNGSQPREVLPYDEPDDLNGEEGLDNAAVEA